MKLITVVSAALLTLGVAVAQAAPVITVEGPGVLNSTVAGATVVYAFDDFNCPYLACTGDYAVLAGSIAGQAALPAGTTPNYFSVPYAQSSGSVDLTLPGFTADYFGLFWGSIDTYNTLEFYLNGGLVAAIDGADLPGLDANGNQIEPSSNRFVNIQFDNGETFNMIRMTSTQFAFESDNHTFAGGTVPVPEPTTVMLMLLGLAGLRSSRRRMN